MPCPIDRSVKQCNAPIVQSMSDSKPPSKRLCTCVGNQMQSSTMIDREQYKQGGGFFSEISKTTDAGIPVSD